MSNVFEPMTPAEQARFRAAYLAYLQRRDGVPDMKTQRFDVRERFFAELDATPSVWIGTPPVNQRVFDRNHARRMPEPNLDEVTLWALATAKTNRAERYGVEYALVYNDRSLNAANDPHAYIQIEEFYHTRILRDALATIGLRMEMGRPSFTTRTLVRAMVRLPEKYANVVVLCGEICGVAVFSLLLEKARELFAHQPKVLARHEKLFGQIMVDEVGHVHFVRSGLSPQRLAWARLILPFVAWGLLEDSPELSRLFGREEIMRRILEADVDSAAASYPDRFQLAAGFTPA
ncbi:hypothetical protein D3C86_468590 [compost metagenome]